MATVVANNDKHIAVSLIPQEEIDLIVTNSYFSSNWSYCRGRSHALSLVILIASLEIGPHLDGNSESATTQGESSESAVTLADRPTTENRLVMCKYFVGKSKVRNIFKKVVMIEWI